MNPLEAEMNNYGGTVQRHARHAANAIIHFDNADDAIRKQHYRANARDAIAECRLAMKAIRRKLKEFEQKCNSYSD